MTQFCSTSDAGLGLTTDAAEVRNQFAVLTVDNENYYLYSVAAQKFVKADRTLVAGIADAIEFADASSEGEHRVRVNFKGIENSYINLGGSNQMIVDGWSTVDAGNAVLFIESGDFDATEALAMLTPEPEPVALEVVSVSPEAGEVAALTEVVVAFSTEVTLDETKSIKLVAEVEEEEEEEENGVTPIEAYVGKWDVYSEWAGYGNYTITGTIEEVSYQGVPALLCTGFSPYAEDGYNDMFLMLYNSEDGSVTLPAQNMQPFEFEGESFDVVLYLTSSTEPKLYGGNLIGNIVDGNIVFENSPSNNNVADSWMMYAPELGNLTYFNSLTWTPATEVSAAPAKVAPVKLNAVDAAIEPIAGGMMKANVVEYSVTAQVSEDDATQLVITINDKLENGVYALVIEEGAVVTADGQANEAIKLIYRVSATGIEVIESNSNAVIYDLTGRKVEKISGKGIYIVNGKKVLVK